jgi:hypothetical protein
MICSAEARALLFGNAPPENFVVAHDAQLFFTLKRSPFRRARRALVLAVPQSGFFTWPDVLYQKTFRKAIKDSPVVFSLMSVRVRRESMRRSKNA